MKKQNTEYLKFALEWGVELGVEIAKDLEDKKLSFSEALALWDNALKIPKIVQSLKHIPAEWNAGKDSEEYTAAIIAGVKQKVKGLSSGTAEDITIQAIKIGIETGRFIDLCIKAHKESKK